MFILLIIFPVKTTAYLPFCNCGGGVCELLGNRSILTSVYNPQTDGMVETLKSMIRRFIHKDECNWDKWLWDEW